MNPPAPSLEIAAAAKVLSAGGVVALPTDTVPGLACLASSATGVQAIFALKGRSGDKPLILFVDSLDAAEQLAGGLTGRQRRLLQRVWPGPLTAILPLTGSWPEGVGRDGAAGFRIPDHLGALALVRAAGGPLATTSANRSGEPTLPRSEDAVGIWGARVTVLPGPAVTAEPSTVVDLLAWPPRVLRPGALGPERLQALIREVEAGGSSDTRREK